MGWGIFSPVQNALGGAVDTARSITGGLAGAVEDAASQAKDFLASPAGQIAMAALLPGAGAALATQLELGAALEGSALASAVGTQAAANAVGSALASVALQTAQGVDLATAVQNAGVNATANLGTPAAAQYVNQIVTTPGVANALTSAGVSTAATLAKGGNGEDAFKNALISSEASALNPTIGREAAIATATYLNTQDAMKAAQAAAGEAGAKASATTTPPDTTKTAVADTTPATTTPPEPAQPTITDTSATPTAVADQNAVSDIPELVITAKREPFVSSGISDIPTSSAAKTDTTTQAKSPTTPTTSQSDIFVLSGQYPSASGGSALGRALGTDLQSSYAPPTSTTGLTAYRPAGEIESEETGQKRQDVWNEASLRLKDALGL